MSSNEREPLLRVRNLTATFRGPRVTAVDDVSFDVRRGEVLGLVGESGCGKTTLLQALLRLDRAVRLDAQSRVFFDGMDLARADERALSAIRGARIAMIFQEPLSALNPVVAIGAQIDEALRRHTDLGRVARRERVLALLRRVELPEPELRARQYPHELSGGMRQRALIALALACEPEILLADEPTTALDATAQAGILALLERVRAELGTALVLVTHDLGVVARSCDRVAVMYAGQIVETGAVADVFRAPRHPYTRALQQALPRAGARGRLAVIPGAVPAPHERASGCRFRERCAFAAERCAREDPELVEGDGARGVRCHFPLEAFAGSAVDSSDASVAHASRERAERGSAALVREQRAPLLEVRGLAKHYPLRGAFFTRGAGALRAVDGVDFALERGTVLGIVGESGCGKTTLAKLLVRLVEPTAGALVFDGEDVARLSGAALRPFRRRAQIVFQDPHSSLDPRLEVGAVLADVLRHRGLVERGEHVARCGVLLEQVGLRAEHAERFPHELSAGQRQRVGIARALAMEPELLVADEPVSALDVSLRAQILNLWLDLKEQLGLTLVFVSHDLAAVEHASDRVLVLYQGRVVEELDGPAFDERARHPYTRELVAAQLSADPARHRALGTPRAEVAASVAPPRGCAFAPRCPLVMPRCRAETPVLAPNAPRQRVACWAVE